jgi:UDPglucose 6-dehydrogenase
MYLGRKHSVQMRLAEATHRANDEQVEFVCKLVLDHIGGKGPGMVVALWGLAFKPETDDVRDAPAIALARFLLERGVRVVGHDPEAGATFARVVSHPSLTIALREYDAVAGADALVLLTEWRSYRAPNFKEIKARMRGDVVIDARNVWRAAEVRRAGLRYQGVGVNPNVPPPVVG